MCLQRYIEANPFHQKNDLPMKHLSLTILAAIVLQAFIASALGVIYLSIGTFIGTFFLFLIFYTPHNVALPTIIVVCAYHFIVQYYPKIKGKISKIGLLWGLILAFVCLMFIGDKMTFNPEMNIEKFIHEVGIWAGVGLFSSIFIPYIHETIFKRLTPKAAS